MRSTFLGRGERGTQKVRPQPGQRRAVLWVSRRPPRWGASLRATPATVAPLSAPGLSVGRVLAALVGLCLASPTSGSAPSFCGSAASGASTGRASSGSSRSSTGWFFGRLPRADHHLCGRETLTADTVPVDVDAVLFWQVHKRRAGGARGGGLPKKAVSWAAQTALRDIIGKTHLADMLTGREAIDVDIKRLIDARTHDWGIVVRSVEIRDVTIPPGLETRVTAGAGRKGEAGAGYSRRCRGGGLCEVRGAALRYRQPDRLPTPGDEYSLRGHEGEELTHGRPLVGRRLARRRRDRRARVDEIADDRLRGRTPKGRGKGELTSSGIES